MLLATLPSTLVPRPVTPNPDTPPMEHVIFPLPNVTPSSSAHKQHAPSSTPLSVVKLAMVHVTRAIRRVPRPAAMPLVLFPLALIHRFHSCHIASRLDLPSHTPPLHLARMRRAVPRPLPVQHVDAVCAVARAPRAAVAPVEPLEPLAVGPAGDAPPVALAVAPLALVVAIHEVTTTHHHDSSSCTCTTTTVVTDDQVTECVTQWLSSLSPFIHHLAAGDLWGFGMLMAEMINGDIVDSTLDKLPFHMQANFLGEAMRTLSPPDIAGLLASLSLYY
ncbi:hypothetical protein Pelo_18527 [Pelomyxa schiedti]|nr:hypothetical protein Pelo_18527 [Pelomyxa schiedti]